MKIKREFFLDMTNKLRYLPMIIARINLLHNELCEVRDNDGLKAMTYDQIMSSATNEIRSRTEATALTNLEAAEILESQIKNHRNYLAKMKKAISQLSDREATIVSRHYFDCETLEIISIDLHTSYRHIVREKKKAIEKLCFLFNGDIAFENEERQSISETSIG